MNTILFALFSLAVAGENPAYFTKVKGTLVGGVLKRETFDFSPGTLVDCVRKSVLAELTTFNCGLEKAVMTATDGGRTISIPFERLWVRYQSHRGGPFHEFVFTGRYEGEGMSSDARLVLWYYTSAPKDLHGSLSLTRYGVTQGIHATEVE